eukprot:scaffold152562_cov14-Tisochrysis_lutea.AAC.1
MNVKAAGDPLPWMGSRSDEKLPTGSQDVAAGLVRGIGEQDNEMSASSASGRAVGSQQQVEQEGGGQLPAIKGFEDRVPYPGSGPIWSRQNGGAGGIEGSSSSSSSSSGAESRSSRGRGL